MSANPGPARSPHAFWLTDCKTASSSSAEQFDLDGMRTDIDGKLFAARPDAGTVAVFAPDGTPLPEIRLLKKGPTNLAFGGPDGKTVFVTQSEGEHGFIEAFGVDRPGREFCMLRPPGSC